MRLLGGVQQQQQDEQEQRWAGSHDLGPRLHIPPFRAAHAPFSRHSGIILPNLPGTREGAA